MLVETGAKDVVVHDDFHVGLFATVVHHSDRHAYEILSRTARKLTMRRLKATLINHMNSDEPDKLVAHPGGFMAHVEGQQRYSYESDPDGRVVSAFAQKRLAKKFLGRGRDGHEQHEWHVWFKADGNTVIPGAHEHYDYNF